VAVALAVVGAVIAVAGIIAGFVAMVRAKKLDAPEP